MPEAKKSLLIVDDERDLCELLKTKFKSFGFEVYVAYDGAEGFKKAVEFVPDCILLDIRLEKGNGLATLRQLRSYRHEDPKRQDSVRRIPVMMLTAAGKNMRSFFQLEGAAGYIEKPFDTADLKERILQAIAKKESGAEPQKSQFPQHKII